MIIWLIFFLFLQTKPLYSLPYMYTLYNVHVLTPTCTVQYVISCAVNIWLLFYTCFLTMRSKHASSTILNDIGRNSLLGKRKKIAKFLMRTFTYRSTFLYDFTFIRNRFDYVCIYFKLWSLQIFVYFSRNINVNYWIYRVILSGGIPNKSYFELYWILAI